MLITNIIVKGKIVNKMRNILIMFLVCLRCFSAKAMETPEQRLLQAAYENDVSTVIRCIEQEGVDVNAKCWVVGCLKMTTDRIKKRKLFFSPLFDYYEQSGSTALHYAAESGAIAVVKYLLAQPDINLEYMSYGHTALHRAIIYKNYDIVQLLIKAGANCTKAPEYLLAQSVRDRAVKKEQRQCVVKLTENIELYQLQLYAALEHNDEQQVRLLLRKLPYTLKDQEGNTILHRAVRYCSPELVGLILKLDTQAITKQNKHGQTPVDVALIYDRLDIVELFTKLAYAEPELSNYSKDSGRALMRCQMKCQIL